MYYPILRELTSYETDVFWLQMCGSRSSTSGPLDDPVWLSPYDSNTAKHRDAGHIPNLNRVLVLISGLIPVFCCAVSDAENR